MNKGSPFTRIKSFARLGKATIALPVALTGFLGYFLYKPVFDLHGLWTLGGVFLLAAGSGALNQLQERKTDALMQRTARRPIPAGIISPGQALLFALVVSGAGTWLLWLTGQLLAAGLGLFTLIWYNGVYTPLKRVTAFAVFPGAVIGALPPLIGWTAAGGDPLEMEILAVSFLLFTGQMPHYWLLLLKNGEQFRDAGLPVVTSLLVPRQIRNISFTWIAATAVIVLMLPATPVIRNHWIALGLVLVAVLFLVRMFLLSYRDDLLKHWKKAFITVNLFYLVIILALLADRVVMITTKFN